MNKINEYDRYDAQQTAETLYALPFNVYEDFCDAYPVESCLVIIVGQGLVTELDEKQTLLLYATPTILQRFLAALKVSA